MDTTLFTTAFLGTSLMFGLFQVSAIQKLFQSKVLFWTLITTVLAGYLTAAWLQQEPVGDVMLFGSAGEYLRKKIDFYWIDSAHSQYPFFPFLIFLHAVLAWLGNLMGVSFTFLLKCTLLAPLGYLTYWVSSKQQTPLARRASAITFLSSPITYSVVFYHGQVDIFLMAFFVLSMSLWSFRNPSITQTVASSLTYAASVASKTWSILFMPLLLKFQRDKIQWFLFGSLTVFALLANIVFYTRWVIGSSVSTVIPALLAPGGPIGLWGITLITPLIPTLLAYKLPIYIILLAVGYWLILGRKMTFWQSVTLFILWLYIVAIHWAVQYLFWALPFLLILRTWVGQKWFHTFHLLASLYVLGSYLNVAHHGVLVNPTLIAGVGVVLWVMTAWQLAFQIKNAPKSAILQS